MPTIAAGTSATFSVPAGQLVTMSAGTGIAVLVYPTSSPIAITAKSVLGPYEATRIVNIAATTAVDYTVALPSTGTGPSAALGIVTKPTITTPAVAGTSITGAFNAVGTPTPSTAIAWLLDDAVISGANAIPYASQASDAGKALKLRVTATNTSGTLVSTSDAVTVSAATGGIVALNSATIFGGSHAAYGQPYVTGAAPNGGGGTSLSDLGFMNDQLRKTGPGLDLINLRAEGGTTVFQQRASQLPQTLTDPSEGAIYYSSANAYNDTTSAPLNGGVPYTQAQIIAAEIDIMQQVAASKKWAIWFNLTPVSQAGTTGAKPRASEFPAHNAAMKTEANKHANILFIDAYTFFLDPASPELNPKTDYIQAVDGIHKTTLGARLFAEYYTPIVAAFIASFTKYRTKGANMLKPWTGTGGTALPGTGTITGIENLPAGYQLEVASGTTNVVITKPDANTVRVAMNNPAASTASTVQIISTNGAEMVAAMVSGDAIQGGFDFAQVGTATGLTRVATSIRINGSASGTSWRSMFRDTSFEPDASFKMDQRALSARRLWNPWRLPSTPTAVDYFIQWNLLAQGNATFDITTTEVCKLV